MWIRLIFVAAVAFGFWRLVRESWEFVIRVGPTGVISHSGIKDGRQKKLLGMCQTIRFAEGQVTIRGRTGRDGRLQLSFSGPIDPEIRQQIRNFLLAEF